MFIVEELVSLTNTLVIIIIMARSHQMRDRIVHSIKLQKQSGLDPHFLRDFWQTTWAQDPLL